MNIVVALETVCEKQVKSIQADWGKEFRNQDLETELRQRGTTMKETVPYHRETNAVVERANRTIFTMNRIIIAQSGLPRGMWDYASAWSAHTKNRVPHKSLNNKSPIRILFPESDLTQQRANLRKFGEEVICYDYSITDKLSPRSFQGRIIGYTHTHGTYQVLDKKGAVKIAKNPKTIREDEDEETIGETREPTKDEQRNTDENSQEQENLTEQELPEKPTSPPPAPRKKRTQKNWEDLVGSREPSTRIKQPTWKIQPVGADSDHPTDKQA